MSDKLSLRQRPDNTISETNCLFQQPWWLDAVAPGRWGEVIISKGGNIEARLPYVQATRFGLKFITLPKLTPILGPWINDCDLRNASRISREKELFTELILKLPTHDFFFQNFHPSITNWQPFFWHGFDQRTDYTYILEDLTDLDLIWSNFIFQVRANIRKAEKQVKVTSEADIEKFLEINKKTFERQQKSLPYSEALVKRLDEACDRNQARKMFFSEDSRGRVHAAIYIVWDDRCAYYLMGGADPELRNSGAFSLLMWEAIKFASTVTRQFNFEGSMIESIERFFRGFGGKQVPYFRVYRCVTKKMKILMAGRDILNAVLSRKIGSLPS